ncbi:CDP-glycerol glycerophosphotransferase family protein, partial [Peribacillus psychrosaccharolyticus]
HGVIIHNIAPYLSKEQYNQQLFIASSEAEKEVIKQTLGYEDQDVVVTGLSRFDNLHNLSVKKQILIMPTWRRSIFNLNKSQFLRSLYFNRYFELVRNEKLLKILEEKQIVLKFYVHSQMQKFLPEFAFEHPNVQFLTKQDAIVSELLKESSLLVTDYSSVMADFLYMDKSVLLYQFDPYDNHHGPVQQISYDDFGEVYDEEDSLVEAITKSINDDFKISSAYQEKSNTFFAHKDQKNSARIFKAINDLKGARK